MPFCTNCGAPVNPGDSFCEYCGTRIAGLSGIAPAGEQTSEVPVEEQPEGVQEPEAFEEPESAQDTEPPVDNGPAEEPSETEETSAVEGDAEEAPKNAEREQEEVVDSLPEQDQNSGEQQIENTVEAGPSAAEPPKAPEQRSYIAGAIIGIAFAILIPLVGLIVSAATLSALKKLKVRLNGGNIAAKVLSILGIVLSVLVMALCAVIVILNFGQVMTFVSSLFSAVI